MKENEDRLAKEMLEQQKQRRRIHNLRIEPLPDSCDQVL
jgi:hypothetical protein